MSPVRKSSLVTFICAVAVIVPVSVGFAWEGDVTRVLDGQTLIIMRNGTPEHVRLFGIESPDNGRPFAEEALATLKGLAYKQKVRVLPVEKDAAGRTVARIKNIYGTDVAQALVYTGVARWCRNAAPHDARLQSSEMDARNHQRGVWASASKDAVTRTGVGRMSRAGKGRDYR
jgi:endonuclease YncB( thermonuclease family)